MSIAAIESVLHQMRATALQGGFAPRMDSGASEAVQGSGGFAGEFKRTLERINGTQQQAYGKAEDFELGKPGVALNDVMVDLQKANVAFQTGLQVRNRLVAAYQEVMSLPA
ncbi:flagellar hook-basal body complex protein FliE [Variovorax sp. OV329]|uniref:flagellar hook-basal body complex protein FliE n=1 Tax=Variovorax sp. OV329 TaxID=1882825 RepID=UPI0008E8B979|nr:flagellar hook-basal body complex protein FliE [Variovorax sp. OV329]SFM65488.1 flagellar hook-basal body complex protein FliE [Variovorax sp. OV329]